MKFGFILTIIVFFLAACATRTELTSSKSWRPPETLEKKKSTPKDQDTMALKLFEGILDASLGDREKAIPSMIKGYEEMINCCPDASITQEAYWRLIEIYLYDIDPPELNKALEVNDQFLKRYPASIIKGFIEESLIEFYYQKGMWERLLRMEAIKDALSSDNLRHIFFYSEANFNLHRTKEAEEGYRKIIEKAPNSELAIKSKRRLGLKQIH